MGNRAKYKIGQEVSFLFAGYEESGEIIDIIRDTNSIKYKIINNKGTLYPVLQDKVINRTK